MLLFQFLVIGATIRFTGITTVVVAIIIITIIIVLVIIIIIIAITQCLPCIGI